jgi:hypothetical protein
LPVALGQELPAGLEELDLPVRRRSEGRDEAEVVEAGDALANAALADVGRRIELPVGEGLAGLVGERLEEGRLATVGVERRERLVDAVGHGGGVPVCVAKVANAGEVLAVLSGEPRPREARRDEANVEPPGEPGEELEDGLTLLSATLAEGRTHANGEDRRLGSGVEQGRRREEVLEGRPTTGEARDGVGGEVPRPASIATGDGQDLTPEVARDAPLLELVEEVGRGPVGGEVPDGPDERLANVGAREQVRPNGRRGGVLALEVDHGGRRDRRLAGGREAGFTGRRGVGRSHLIASCLGSGSRRPDREKSISPGVQPRGTSLRGRAVHDTHSRRVGPLPRPGRFRQVPSLESGRPAHT